MIGSSSQKAQNTGLQSRKSGPAEKFFLENPAEVRLTCTASAIIAGVVATNQLLTGTQRRTWARVALSVRPTPPLCF
jgi:hypothetical protein